MDIVRAPLREEGEPEEDGGSQHSSQGDDHEESHPQPQQDRAQPLQSNHQEHDALTTLHTQIQAARAQLQVDLTVFANTNATLVTQQQYIVQKVEELQASEAGRIQAMEYTLANIESQLQLFASDIAWIKRQMVAAEPQPVNLMQPFQNRVERIRAPMPEGGPQGAEQGILTPTTVGYESLPVSPMPTPRATSPTLQNQEAATRGQHQEMPNVEQQPERHDGNGTTTVVEVSDDSDEEALVATLATSVTPS